MSNLSTRAQVPTGLRVALVHDWMTGMRGGEKCLEVMAEIFPEADIFTLLHVKGSCSPTLERHRIFTSFIQRLPAAAKIYRWALPLFPRAIESFDFSNYDLVLSSSHCVAKSAITGPETLSVCYCYTPMRYVWDRFDDYFGNKGFLTRSLIGLQAAKLRRWDRRTASRVNMWLPISTIVKQRLLDWYGVSANKTSIVFPPVDVGRFSDAKHLPVPEGMTNRGYDLVVSALVAYKRIDLAVKATKLANRTLAVIGSGPELGRLKALAKEAPGTGRVIFPGAVSDAELPAWYVHCRAFVFPGLEDFGITPLEATAAGRPVVAYKAGGVLDTIREGLNGLFFSEQNVESLVATLGNPTLADDWDHEAMIAHSVNFSRERYRQDMERELEAAWQNFNTNRNIAAK